MSAYEKRILHVINDFWSEFEQPSAGETEDGVGVSATHMDSPLLSATPLISVSIFLYKQEIDMLSDDELSSRIDHGLVKALGGTSDEYDYQELPWDLSERAPEFQSAQVNLFVLDVERSVTFYSEKLGFEESFRTPESASPEYVVLHLDELTISIVSNKYALSTHGPTTNGSPMAGVCLWTENINEAYGRLVAQGVEFLIEPQDFLNGRFRTAWLYDPDRNPVQISQECADAGRPVR